LAGASPDLIKSSSEKCQLKSAVIAAYSVALPRLGRTWNRTLLHVRAVTSGGAPLRRYGSLATRGSSTPFSGRFDLRELVKVIHLVCLT
jgi:hypothetical protein